MPVPAATFCPEVSIPGRFPIPLPSSDCCCSEPLQRSRFTSHKSVWRRKGSGGTPGKGRERRLSLPLPQTLSRCPGQAAAGPPVVTRPLASPSACPVLLERCPKWIEEPPRENEPAAIPQPANRQWGAHCTGLPDEAQGPWTSLRGPRKMGAQPPFGDQSRALPSLLQLGLSQPKGSCSPISRFSAVFAYRPTLPVAGTPLLPGPQTWPRP